MKSTIALKILIALLFVSMFPYAQAQDQSLYSLYKSDTRVDKYGAGCTIIERRGGLLNGNSLSESARRKFAAKAAQAALDQGYNYAIISPLIKAGYADSRDVVKYGWGEARKATVEGAKQKLWAQSCLTVDDQLAFDLLFNPSGVEGVSMTPNDGLVDVREFVRTLNLDVSVPPRMPNISEERFKLPGDRERIYALHSIQAGTADCHPGLKPVSLENFRSAETVDLTCLEGLRGQALASGWENFPLVASENAATRQSKGYTLNRSTTAPVTTRHLDPLKGRDVSAQWGKGYPVTDMSDHFPSFSGTILQVEHGRELILMSNTLGETDFIDHAVLITAQANLRNDDNGVYLTDETQNFRKKFEDEKISILSERESDSARRYKNDTDDINADIARLDKLIASSERDLAEAKAAPVDVIDMSEFEELMKAFPNADMDIEKFRAQMKDVSNNDHNGFVKSYTRVLNERRQERRDLVAQLPQNSAPQPSVQASGAGQFELHEISENASAEDATSFRAFELFKNVMILNYGAGSYDCDPKFLVCADKMQVYSALGPELLGSKYHAVETPPNYQTYEAR